MSFNLLRSVIKLYLFTEDRKLKSLQLNPEDVYNSIRKNLTIDLLKPKYRKMHENGCDPRTGHCFVASEAFYWLMGGPGSGYKPMVVKHEGGTHWWVQGPDGKIWDLTSEQFSTPVPYNKGRSIGFGVGGKIKKGPHPSARARILMKRVVEDLKSK